ncbi:glycine--tRNA ligase subunit beta [Parvularcula sp. LCG005]|uniref:glycine--tRNA ligase subunit beta n=1 Tax=Parvularcula sp. LCG005 TaxID=3078805 RepID=UPI002942A30B|nr:glycine--tRNA ligase subunit beta [Parvularcula sp. LCG005]WOI52791.1 glycine--tRNA ligase subunit beta [Parvularcula sp. LCG005]
MPDLLLEIFSEEIPARMQRRAADDLSRLVGDRLAKAGYAPTDQKAFSTPRRLTLVVTGLPTAQADRREERKGPRVGAPEKALEGFLKSAGLSSIDEATIQDDKKGQFYVAVIEEKGRPTPDVLASIIPEIIETFPWPKSMRWGDGSLRWVRPLHRILCTFNGEVVPFTVAGIESGDVTEGHRFLAPDEIQARSFEPYAEALQRQKVILDPDDREERILGESQALAAAQGYELVEDAGLLAEVAGLAEWPVPRIGSFDPKFLTVPDEALIASMKGHQKYFSVRDPATGRLAPKFICVANIEPPDGGAAMMVGYERVLSARLSDAWFLYQQDLKKPLAVHAEKLKSITFFEGLGTVANKVERVAALAREIAPIVSADPNAAEKAARLAKADLVTEMVGEFPELQGVMGRYYAMEEGIEPAIADAIRDHYKPAGQGDDVPTAPVSVAVALAEKLATLAMFWSIDEKPTGSKDPFALRRMALGVIQIVLENGVRFGVTDLLNDLAADKKSDLLSFFHDRLSVYLRDKGYRHDHVRAVLPAGETDFVLVVRKLNALQASLKTDDGTNLIAAYKRAGNILKAEGKKDGAPIVADVQSSLLAEPGEKDLASALSQAEQTALPALKNEDFEAAMSALSTLRAPLDRFFEGVTVNVDDEALRKNRLGLLQSIVSLCDLVADFSQLEG